MAETPGSARCDREAARSGSALLVVPLVGTPTDVLVTFLRGLGYAARRLPDLPPQQSAARAGADGWPWGVPEPAQLWIVPPTWAAAIPERVYAAGAQVAALIRDPRDATLAVLTGAGGDRSREVGAGGADRAGVGDDLAVACARVAGELRLLGACCADGRTRLLRYEALVPPRLGGDEGRQLDTLVGLAALVGWRGSAFTLARAILATHAERGVDDAGSAVGRPRPGNEPGNGPGDGPADGPGGEELERVEAQLRPLLAEWGYEAPAAGPPHAQGAVAGLVASLVREHADVRAALTDRHAEARRELELVEAAARTVQERLAAERARFGPLRRGLAALAGARRRLRAAADGCRSAQ